MVEKKTLRASQSGPTVRTFVPENWGQVDRFTKLSVKTYAFAPAESRALAGVSAHLEKAQIFASLAEELRTSLSIDEQQLSDRGWTPALHAKKLAAVVEAFVTELYASVDCTAQVLRAIFHRSTRGFRKSTSYLFTKTEKIHGLPEPIADTIQSADWFLPLRYLRDEVTHLDVGFCSLNKESETVSYTHFGMKRDGNIVVYKDIFAMMKYNFAAINDFVGGIFHLLQSTLCDEPVELICGICEGRILSRRIVPTEPIDFNSGVCLSLDWFELPENPDCPFAANCGAHKRAKLERSRD